MGDMHIGGGGDLGQLFGLDDPVSGFNNARQEIQQQKSEAAQTLSDIFGDYTSRSPLDSVIAEFQSNKWSQSPFQPVLVRSGDFNNREVHDITTRLSGAQQTQSSGPVKGNGWFASNPFVMFRMMFFEVMAILQAAKAIEKMVDIQQMNQVWDLGQTSAGLIMASAKEEAMKHVSAAAMSAVSMTMQFVMLGSSLRQTRKAKGETQSGIDTLKQQEEAAKKTYRDAAKGFRDRLKSFGKRSRSSVNDFIGMQKYRMRKLNLRRRGYEPAEHDPDGNRIFRHKDGRTKVVDKSKFRRRRDENVQAGHQPQDVAGQNRTREERERVKEEQKAELEKKKKAWKEARADRKRAEATSTSTMNQLREARMTNLRILSQSVEAATDAVKNALMAHFTLKKATYDAMLEVTKAARTIAEKAMQSAAQAHTEASDLITKLIEQLTAMTKANMEAHKMSR